MSKRSIFRSVFGIRKVCKRAKGNKEEYGKKCRYGGSCDGKKKNCVHAIY